MAAVRCRLAYSFNPTKRESRCHISNCTLNEGYKTLFQLQYKILTMFMNETRKTLHVNKAFSRLSPSRKRDCFADYVLLTQGTQPPPLGNA